MVPCSLPGVLVTLWIIDRLGRKKTMALCFVVFSLCSLLLFICVGRWVVTPALSGQQAGVSGPGQWLFGPVGHRLHLLGVIRGIPSSPSLALRPENYQKIGLKVGAPRGGLVQVLLQYQYIKTLDIISQ